MNPYFIGIYMKQRQNELDKELMRIRLLRTMNQPHADIIGFQKNILEGQREEAVYLIPRRPITHQNLFQECYKSEPHRNSESKRMSFRGHWIRFLYRVATGTGRTRKLLTPLGVMIFGAFTSLFSVLAMITDKWLLLPWPFSHSLSEWVAILLIVPGAVLIFWSAFHFLKMKGTPVPFNPPPKLVVTGPYQFVRNPMVTGIFIMLFGIGFAVKSPSLICIFTPLYIWANVWELKNIEEPELRKRLGDDYAVYQRQTPMFLPPLHH